MVKRFDKSGNSHIVSENQVNKGTPLNGVGSTKQGLTSQADFASMEAVENPISALSSRQLLSPAVDGFFDRAVEYCSPPQEVVDAFIQAAVCELEDIIGADTASRQGFRQFLTIVIRITTKEANGRSVEQ
jgi:hypothetical protein